MNKVILSGNLTKTPEVKTTPTGVTYAKMSIAVNRTYSKDNNATDFFNLTAWNKTAEFCGKYFQKGSSIIVIGRVENNNYEDKNGVKHYGVNINVESVEFAGSKKDTAPNDSNAVDSNDDDEVDVPF